MQYHKELKDVEENVGFVLPDEGDYILKVLDVVDGISSKGNKMLTIALDIAEGKFKNHYANSQYPLKSYHVYQTDDQLSKWKTVLKSFQKSNPEYITESEVETDNFDETKLRGLEIGAKLTHKEYEKDGKKNLSCKIAWLFSTDRVRQSKDYMGEFNPVMSQEVDKRSSEEIDESIPF